MTIRYKGPQDEIRALDAFIKLMRCADSVSARLMPSLAKHGMTESQFGALEALYHLGPLHQCDLGRKLLRTSGNVTMVVDNLEKRGLVRRERDGDDRRFVTVRLTEEGAKLMRNLFPLHAKRIQDEMNALSVQELKELARLCRKLGKRAE